MFAKMTVTYKRVVPFSSNRTLSVLILMHIVVLVLRFSRLHFDVNVRLSATSRNECWELSSLSYWEEACSSSAPHISITHNTSPLPILHEAAGNDQPIRLTLKMATASCDETSGKLLTFDAAHHRKPKFWILWLLQIQQKAYACVHEIGYCGKNKPFSPSFVFCHG
jgi:hypothetical protein